VIGKARLEEREPGKEGEEHRDNLPRGRGRGGNALLGSLEGTSTLTRGTV